MALEGNDKCIEYLIEFVSQVDPYIQAANGGYRQVVLTWICRSTIQNGTVAAAGTMAQGTIKVQQDIEFLELKDTPRSSCLSILDTERQLDSTSPYLIISISSIAFGLQMSGRTKYSTKPDSTKARAR